MRKVAKFWMVGGKSLGFIIPKDMAEELGWKAGEYIVIKLVDGELRVRRLKLGVKA